LIWCSWHTLISLLLILLPSSQPFLSLSNSMKFTTFWDIAPWWVLFVPIMAAVRTSEMSVCFYETTWHKIPEGSQIQTHCYKNLKYNFLYFIFQKSFVTKFSVRFFFTNLSFINSILWWGSALLGTSATVGSSWSICTEKYTQRGGETESPRMKELYSESGNRIETALKVGSSI
jgi:hypothetical protein